MRYSNAILRKELVDALKNWEVVYTLLAVPVAIILLLSIIINQDAGETGFIQKILELENIPFLIDKLGLSSYGKEASFFLLMWNTIYFYAILIIAFPIPAVLAATSITGEKEQGTIEILFTSPVPDRVIIYSKLLASILPPLIISFICYFFAIVYSYINFGFEVATYFFHGKWILLHIIVLPVFIIIAACIGMTVSITKNSSRAAIMTTFFAIIPILLLAIPIIYGEIIFDIRASIVAILLGFFLLTGVIYIMLKKFDKEKIILRYK